MSLFQHSVQRDVLGVVGEAAFQGVRLQLPAAQLLGSVNATANGRKGLANLDVVPRLSAACRSVADSRFRAHPCHTHPVAVINRVRARTFVMQHMGKYAFRFGTRLMGADELLFINFGYEEDPPMALPLAASDEPDRFCIQLYHRTANQVDLSGKRVLEVSCGHGGGASYLVRTLRPASYTGLDLNPAGIDFCRKRHHLPGLDFVQGNAENLPFDARSFDAVINVEASHLYSRFPLVLAEVARVLRPGGHFLYTDFRRRRGIAEWDAVLADAPIRLVSVRVIDDEVRRGVEKNSPRMQDIISRRVPTLLQGLARNEAFVRGGKRYRAVQSGEFSYRAYCFAKD
jgi:SAM-dependent methyltransferase